MVWQSPPPAGSYLVRVDTASLCGAAAARWTVGVTRDGTTIGAAAGESLPGDARFSKGPGSGIQALAFDVPAAVTAGAARRSRRSRRSRSARRCAPGGRWRPTDAGSIYDVVRVPGGTPQAVETAVDAETARHLPGTGGDAALAAQDLPGVARPAPGATGVVVWGAAPAESRVLFDGVEIPALTHFGGFRSTVGAELVGRIDVVPGAYGAEYGRALGGLVRIEPRPLETGGSHLVLDANLLDGGAAWRGGIGRLRLAAAARTSYLDQTYGRVLPASTLDSTSAQSLFPIPRYSDAQLEAVVAGRDARHAARERAGVFRSRAARSRRRGLRAAGAHPGPARRLVAGRAHLRGARRRRRARRDAVRGRRPDRRRPALRRRARVAVDLQPRARPARALPRPRRPAVAPDAGARRLAAIVRRAARRQPDHPRARGRSGDLRPAARRRCQRRPLVRDRRRDRALRERDVHARRLERDAERARQRLPRRRQPRAAAHRRHAPRRLRAPRRRDRSAALGRVRDLARGDRDGSRRPLPPAGRGRGSERGVRLARAGAGPRGARDAVAVGEAGCAHHRRGAPLLPAPRPPGGPLAAGHAGAGRGAGRQTGAGAAPDWI